MTYMTPFAARIRKTLTEAYCQVTGVLPDDGGWTPNDEVCEKLRVYEEEKGAASLNKFLSEAVQAHLHRTRTSHTPFFVNSHLLSESSLTYLKKHRQYLRQMYGEASDPNQFTNQVFAEVYKTERDYLAMACHYHLLGQPMDWGVMSPTPFWVLASEMFERFSKPPTQYWSNQPVNYGGKVVPLGEACVLERKRLSSSNRRTRVSEAANKAMLEAAQAWTSQNHLITFFYDDFGKLAHTPNPHIDPSLIRVMKPLIDRDEALFSAARSVWESKGKTFKEKPPKPVKPDSSGSPSRKLFLDPNLAKMLAATEID